MASTLARTARPAPVSPLNAVVSEARRYVMIGTDLDDYRKVRSRLTRGNYADDVSINDVVLATISGAFRSLAADPRRGGPLGDDGARHGAGERLRRRPADPARQAA